MQYTSARQGQPVNYITFINYFTPVNFLVNWLTRQLVN